MDKNFWKGVLVGAGGLFVLSFVMSYLGVLPWILLGAGGVYGYYRITKKSPDQLPDPSSKVQQISEEVDRRIKEFRKSPRD
ncbi:MAG: hypothetical protein AAF449_03260 [Myxococcota bacterium]